MTREIKAQIRKEILSKLHRQARKEALKKSEIIKNKLFSLPEFEKAIYVMLYASLSEEVDTTRIIDEALEIGKKVALPRCESPEKIVPKQITDRRSDLEKGSYGIYEPKECQKNVKLEDIDLIVVPGIAFDKEQNRLGRGKGYYDKFLNELPGNKVTVGLAFDFQIVGNLPKDSHDIPVSKVITN